MTFHWRQLTTEQRIQAIKAVHTMGASAAVIAAEIGGVSRNAIIGMYDRHSTALASHPLGGVVGRPRRSVRDANPVRRDSSKQWKVVTKVSNFDREDELAVVHKGDVVDLRDLPGMKRIKPQPANDADYAPRNVGLMDLAPSDCRWPTNDAAKGQQHLFCGHTRLLGYSWCERHYSRAFDASQTTGR